MVYKNNNNYQLFYLDVNGLFIAYLDLYPNISRKIYKQTYFMLLNDLNLITSFRFKNSVYSLFLPPL
jgi:hypothetical protein